MTAIISAISNVATTNKRRPWNIAAPTGNPAPAIVLSAPTVHPKVAMALLDSCPETSVISGAPVAWLVSASYVAPDIAFHERVRGRDILGFGDGTRAAQSRRSNDGVNERDFHLVEILRTVRFV